MRLREFFIHIIMFGLLISGLFIYTEKVYASGSDLTNIMQNWDGYEDADTEVISDEGASGFVINAIEILICIGIYLVFSANFIIIAIDLLYIGVPPIRTLLWNESKSVSLVEGKTNIEKSGKQIISDDLKYAVLKLQKEIESSENSNGKIVSKSSLATNYLKRKSIILVLLSAIIILLITSGVFLETGFNVGEAVLKMLGVK